MVAAVAMVVLLLALGWLAWKQRTAQQKTEDIVLKGELQQLQREVDALEGQLRKMKEQLRPDGTESEARENGGIESQAEATGTLEQFQESRGRGGRPSSAAAARGDARPPDESGYAIPETALAADDDEPMTNGDVQ